MMRESPTFPHSCPWKMTQGTRGGVPLCEKGLSVHSMNPDAQGHKGQLHKVEGHQLSEVHNAKMGIFRESPSWGVGWVLTAPVGQFWERSYQTASSSHLTLLPLGQTDSDPKLPFVILLFFSFLTQSIQTLGRGSTCWSQIKRDRNQLRSLLPAGHSGAHP